MNPSEQSAAHLTQRETELNTTLSQSLYISDLDGTLLDSVGELSIPSRAYMQEALELGAQFSAATARGIPSTLRALEGLPLRLPLIAKNGAALASAEDGRVLDAHYFPPELCALVFERLSNQYQQPHVHSIIDQQEVVFVGPKKTAAMEWYLNKHLEAGEKRFRDVQDLSSHIDNQVLSFVLFDDYQKIAQEAEILRRDFGDTLMVLDLPELYKPEYGFLVVGSKLANKAGGIELLYRHMPDLSTLPLTVFGDEANDREIFQIAARSIAPANAVSEIQAMADLVIGRNTTDSVARFIVNEVRIRAGLSRFQDFPASG